MSPGLHTPPLQFVRAAMPPVPSAAWPPEREAVAAWPPHFGGSTFVSARAQRIHLLERIRERRHLPRTAELPQRHDLLHPREHGRPDRCRSAMMRAAHFID